jgi:hypothetical protein
MLAGSVKAARWRGVRRCVVDHVGERKKKIFFSLVGPAWQPQWKGKWPGPQWLASWAELVGLGPLAGFLYIFFSSSFFFSFSIFCFEISYLTFNSVLHNIELGTSKPHYRSFKLSILTCRLSTSLHIHSHPINIICPSVCYLHPVQVLWTQHELMGVFRQDSVLRIQNTKKRKGSSCSLPLPPNAGCHTL